MNRIKTPRKWLYRLADAVAPRSEAERHAQHVTAYILILLAAVALFYQAIT
jgi:hypothetical protein